VLGFASLVQGADGEAELVDSFFFAVANSAGAAGKNAGAATRSVGGVANSAGAATRSVGGVANSAGAVANSAAVVVRFVLHDALQSHVEN